MLKQKIDSSKLQTNLLLQDIKKYALNNKVPIINDEGLLYLKELVVKENINRILELGTAIAFSSINLALLSKQIKLDTIERDEKMYNLAKENVKSLNLEKQISLHFADALEIDLNVLSNEYDLIFIDAAKAQYKKLFLKFEALLKPQGLIVCDNLLFHGLVKEYDTIRNRNLRALVRKIMNFKEWLANNETYVTSFVDIGDGMAVSIKK